MNEIVENGVLTPIPYMNIYANEYSIRNSFYIHLLLYANKMVFFCIFSYDWEYVCECH